MEDRYTKRFKSYCNSLESLKEARERDPGDSFVLSGTVQKFSLTFDISWKIMKDIIVNYHKIQSFATGSPRETLRIAASVNLVDDDRWMEMLDKRNELSHDYDGGMAEELFPVIISEYIPLFEKFRDVCRELIEPELR